MTVIARFSDVSSTGHAQIMLQGLFGEGHPVGRGSVPVDLCLAVPLLGHRTVPVCSHLPRARRWLPHGHREGLEASRAVPPVDELA